MKKILFILLGVVLFGTTVQAAPPAGTFYKSLLPLSNSDYYLGTTTPSINAWKGVITDQLCLTADTCYTNLSSATSGGNAVATSSAETNTYIPFWTTTNGAPALLSGGSSNFTWDGTKLFAANASTTNLTVSGLTASQAVVTDASKNLASLAYGITSAATSLVERDASQNAFANNFVSKATNVVSAGGTTTLTAASSRAQNLTGSSAQTFKLPDATTLAIGNVFTFNNNSTGTLTVVDNGSNTITTVPAGGKAELLAIAVSTANGAWDYHFLLPSNASYGTAGLSITGTLGVTATTTLASSLNGFLKATSGVVSAALVDLTSNVTGVLPIANGGTNASSQTTNGVAYFNGTSITTGTGFVFDGTNVGIGTTTPSSKLTVAGNVLAEYFTATSTTVTNTFPNASTTNATISSSLSIPNAADPTISAAGALGINTTTASSSLRFFDGTAERSIYSTGYMVLPYASTTAAAYGSANTATTTVRLGTDPRPSTIVSAYCKSDAGTFLYRFGDGTNWTESATCSSSGVLTTFSTNNTFTTYEEKQIQYGSQASSPSTYPITVNLRRDSD